MAARKQPPTVRLRRLAAELRALRTAAGLTREDAAELTHMNSASLWRIETARARPQRRTLLGLLDKYGVTDPQRRADLVELAKDAGQLGWLQAYEDLLPDEYNTYISFESEAQTVCNYESLFVPGTLQTESYARAVTAGLLPDGTEEEVERRVEARLKRQDSLTRADPLKIWAILDEGVLHRKVGGAEVMPTSCSTWPSSPGCRTSQCRCCRTTSAHTLACTARSPSWVSPNPADPELVYIENRVNALFLERERISPATRPSSSTYARRRSIRRLRFD